MLNRLQRYFSEHLQLQGEEQDKAHSLHLAAAALLVEVARADFNLDEKEQIAMAGLLTESLALPAEEVDEIIRLALAESREAASLHPFTSLIHAHYSYGEKVSLMEQLWQVAFADGRLDKYEEHLLRKIAELLYLPHRDYLQAKHRVQARLTSSKEG